MHEHNDGIVDIVGVFLDQIAEAVLLQILVVLVVLGIGLDVEHDVGAHRILLTGLHGIAVLAVGGPPPGLPAAVGPGGHRDLIGHHESGVEAHAELADDIHIALALALILRRHVLLELEGAALGDGAQVLLQLLPGHADAVVRDGEGALDLIGGQGDLEVRAVQSHLVVGEGLVGQLVHRVAGVGDELPQEDLLMGIDGIDHQVQQPL